MKDVTDSFLPSSGTVRHGGEPPSRRILPGGTDPGIAGRLARAILSLLLVAGSTAMPAWADGVPDFEREARIVEQVEPYLFEGEPSWLEGGGQEFLAVHIEVDEAHGTVILLHGRNVHLDEEELIGPLRIGLAERGWATLSLQMPVLARGKTYYDYLPILKYAHPRIEAAIDYLESRGVNRIILAAHSCGVHMANDWMNSVAEPPIDGYIAMGLGVTDVDQDLKTPFPIGRLTVPVLDIYGTGEYPRPLAMVPHRRELLRQNGNPLSAQVPVEGATHFFRGYGDVMVGKLADWLDGLSR